MQDHDWNDLKYLLAIHRTGSFAQAARHMGVDETTVARRLKRLEHDLNCLLLTRLGQGRYELSDAALAVLEYAERIEVDQFALRETLGIVSNRVAGHVRLSSVPFLINRVLIPALAKLTQLHPDVTLDLVPDSRNVDLTKREADLAIRFSRPSEGGLSVKSRKLGDMQFAVFCASHVPQEEIDQLEWCGYDDANASLPQARWVRTLGSVAGQTISNVRVADLETAIETVATGRGKTALPVEICSRDKRLQQLPDVGQSLSMTRPIWLLSHDTQTHRPAIKAVKTWLNQLSWT